MKNIAYDGKFQSGARGALSRAERRRIKQSGGDAGTSMAPEPSCPLLLHLRPLSIADMAPGHTYEPGLTVLTVMTLPVFGNDGRSAVGFDCPIKLPAEYREPTPLNARIALELVCTIDAEAAAMVDDLKQLAREPKSRRFANSPAAGNFLASFRSARDGDGADPSATKV